MTTFQNTPLFLQNLAFGKGVPKCIIKKKCFMFNIYPQQSKLQMIIERNNYFCLFFIQNFPYFEMINRYLDARGIPSSFAVSNFISSVHAWGMWQDKGSSLIKGEEKISQLNSWACKNLKRSLRQVQLEQNFTLSYIENIFKSKMYPWCKELKSKWW